MEWKPPPSSLNLHHIDTTESEPEAIELSGGSQGGVMGMEEISPIAFRHIKQTLILRRKSDVGSAVDSPQHIALRLRALKRMGWINLRGPEVHRVRRMGSRLQDDQRRS